MTRITLLIILVVFGFSSNANSQNRRIPKKIKIKGGTMRLGVYSCKIENNSLAFKIFQQEMIYERHRHRYEFNNLFKNDFSKHGIKFSGINHDLNLIEIIELVSILSPVWS